MAVQDDVKKYLAEAPKAVLRCAKATQENWQDVDMLEANVAFVKALSSLAGCFNCKYFTDE